MHHPVDLGGEGQAGVLLYRQRVDVGTQRNRLARLAADNVGAGAGRIKPAHRESHSLELFHDPVGGPELLVAQLGVLVQLPAEGNDIILQICSQFLAVHDGPTPFSPG